VFEGGGWGAVRTGIDFEEYVLDNGLRVILHVNDRSPLVHVALWYHVGSKNETPDQTGFAHLFEHMMFQGSEHVPKTEHFRLVQSVGGALNATTGQDRTNYFQTLPRENLELALWLESDRMHSLRVSDENYDNQRAVVREERTERYDNAPYGLWYLTLLEMLFAGSPYAWSPIGDMEHLERSPLSSVQEFHRRFYVPNNATLVVAGDLDTTEARRLVEAYFGRIPAGPPIVRPAIVVPPIDEIRRAEIVARVPSPSVYVGFQGVPVGHADARALELLAMILTQGRSSRLHRHLIYDRQIAQSAAAHASPMEMSGLFVTVAVASPGVGALELEGALWDVLDDAVRKPVADRELAGAMNRLVARHVASLGRLQGVADALAYNSVLRGDPRLVNTVLDEYAGVTADDVQRVARHYLQRERSAVLHYLPDRQAP